MTIPTDPRQIPKAGNAERAARGFEHLRERLSRLEDDALSAFCQGVVASPEGRTLLECIFGNSPFLTDCILSDLSGFHELVTRGPEAVVPDTLARLDETVARSEDPAECMAALRKARRRVALAVALADITGSWSLEQVTDALSDFADAAVEAALSHLLRRAAAKGDFAPVDSDRPTQGCGFTVLALGKLGGRELNYSSDIDLIVIFDPERLPYAGKKDVHNFAVRTTRELVRLLEERTRDGYVHRVDLRLRPDPSATPLAISFQAAETYYESLGQNWERAAMIKARACAGDIALGREFISLLRPFVWRKHLDFWAIQDVHSIKRQINAQRGGSTVAVDGHNIKTGRGGIREIEFYVQTQQLIWGGRDTDLRSPRTVEALAALAEAGHVSQEDADTMSAAYRELRRLEHRLQMVEDQQTQRLPETPEGVAEIAAFMGYEDTETFREELLRRLHMVEDRYAMLFEEAPSLSGPGNLVFTGGESDPETLETLASLGFADGERVINTVANWHRGRFRATRSRRARELLTELIPTLLQKLGENPNPDAALGKFDEFLARLPAGVQLFSMLQANPRLMDLLATIMGAAPALADHLSRRPGLLDAVLTPGFFDPVPRRSALLEEMEAALTEARDFQDELDIARRWANDRRFQVGLHLLQGTCGVDEAGRALTEIAEAAIQGLWPRVVSDFAATHGYLPGPGLAILALGKLGGGEMTISSDIDLVFLYETTEEAEDSDGAKPLEPGRYFARLSQRAINAITAPTGEGKLYDVDMRLRPSGNAGPIATTLPGFQRYHGSAAWTWEHMALTRARPIVAEPEFADRIAATVRDILTAPRDPGKLMRDVAEMRARIEKEFPAKSEWDVKYLRGGLVDLEFLAQALQLRHAQQHPQVLAARTQAAFARLAEAGILPQAKAEALIDATRLMRSVQALLRLMSGSSFSEAQAPAGVKAKLAEACGATDFEALRCELVDRAAQVRHVFAELIEAPAAEAAPSGETQKEDRA